MGIALLGPMGSGKTTVAVELERRHGYRRESFATPLKDFAALAYGPIVKDAPYDLRPGGIAGRVSGRQLLQRLGTEAIRNGLDEDFWWRAMERRLAGWPGPVVVDDCRFENESWFLRERGFAFVRLTGRGELPGMTSHISEVELADFPADYAVENKLDPAAVADLIAGLVQ